MRAPTARRAMGPQRRALLCAFVALLLVYAVHNVFHMSIWLRDPKRETTENNKSHVNQYYNTIPQHQTNEFTNSRITLNVYSTDHLGITGVKNQQTNTGDWDAFFVNLNKDVPHQVSEMKIRDELYRTKIVHELSDRFPLETIPIILDTKHGLCFFGSHLTKGSICENAVRTRSTWTPDPHVRDIISTVLLKCSFRSYDDDCFAIDVGSNVGAHTLVMLSLGARVVAIEPQEDLCVASRLSAHANGFENRSYIVCGGLSTSEISDRAATFMVDGAWRYNGASPNRANSAYPYRIGPVPIVSLERLIRDRKKINLLKIDTDSIDCFVLQQAIDLIEKKNLYLKAIILETWDQSCTHGNLIGHQILRLLKLGFTVYRTLVYERSWDEHHRDYENDFKILTLPDGWVEEFQVGFNFVLWRFDTKGLGNDEVLRHPVLYARWQYLFTKDVNMHQAGYLTKDL